MSGKKWLLRAAGICGVLAAAVVLIGILAAMSAYLGFSWSNNVLSDLGVGGTAMAFNSGLMAGGVLAVIFAVGLLIAQKGALGRVGAVLLFVDAIALFGIGMFPETTNVHLPVSMAFFAIFPLAALVFGASAIKAKSRKFGLFTIVLGIIAILPWPITMSITAITEAASAIPVLVWLMIQGVMLYRSAPSK